MNGVHNSSAASIEMWSSALALIGMFTSSSIVPRVQINLYSKKHFECCCKYYSTSSKPNLLLLWRAALALSLVHLANMPT